VASETRFFIAIPSIVLADASLSAVDKLVYGAMLTYQGSHYHCFAARSTIAQRIGVSVRSVASAIQALKSRGYLEAVMVRSEQHGKVVEFQQRGGKQGGKTKCWRCLVPLPKAKVALISRPRLVK
jgi:hypothetical protein